VLAGQGEVGRAEVIGQVGGRQPADHELRQSPRFEALEERTRVGDQSEADLVGRDLPVKEPLPPLRDGEHIGQQVVQFHHLDAAVAHLADEVEVVAAGVLHPQHVIEQQVVAVGRGKPLMSQPRSADQDLPQLPDFGMHAVLSGGR
jgi:hypothetical protein